MFGVIMNPFRCRADTGLPAETIHMIITILQCTIEHRGLWWTWNLIMSLFHTAGINTAKKANWYSVHACEWSQLQLLGVSPGELLKRGISEGDVSMSFSSKEDQHHWSNWAEKVRCTFLLRRKSFNKLTYNWIGSYLYRAFKMSENTHFYM